MSLTGRRTCVSASALNLDAQPAHAERVVRRISRPVCGIGIELLNQNDRKSLLIAGHFTPLAAVYLLKELFRYDSIAVCKPGQGKCLN